MLREIARLRTLVDVTVPLVGLRILHLNVIIGVVYAGLHSRNVFMENARKKKISQTAYMYFHYSEVYHSHGQNDGRTN